MHFICGFVYFVLIPPFYLALKNWNSNHSRQHSLLCGLRNGKCSVRCYRQFPRQVCKAKIMRFVYRSDGETDGKLRTKIQTWLVLRWKPHFHSNVASSDNVTNLRNPQSDSLTCAALLGFTMTYQLYGPLFSHLSVLARPIFSSRWSQEVSDEPVNIV